MAGALELSILPGFSRLIDMKAARYAFFLTLSCALFQAAPGQDSDKQEEPVIRAQVEVVNILATVRDRSGRYVASLQKEDFQILEDGVPQEIQYFSYEAGEDAQALTVVLLIDTSGSVKDKLEFEQKAASEFFQRTLRQNKDLAAIVQFDSEINLVQDFTFDLPRLEKSLNSIRSGGATILYDAIYIATDELLSKQYGRRVLVVLSDGKDTMSVTTREEAIRKAQEEDVLIFGVGIRSASQESDFGALRQFARSTGGGFYRSKVDLAKIRAAFAHINGEIKNQYSLAYVSRNRRRDGRFRTLEVKLKKRGLRINHRKGYYAPRPPAQAESGSGDSFR